MSRYEKAEQAIKDLFSDTSVSIDTTRANLTALRDEIDNLIESLG